MSAKTIPTRAQRRSVLLRTIQAQKMMPSFENMLSKARTAEVTRVLDLLKGHRPEQMPDIVFKAFSEPYLGPIYTKLYQNVGVGTAKLAVNDFLSRKSLYDQLDDWAYVMNQYIQQNAGSKIVLLEGTMKEFMRDKVQDALLNSMELGVEKHTQYIIDSVADEWQNVKPWMVRRIIQTETMIAMSVGQYGSMMQLGIPFKKVWTATFNNTRPQHQQMHGATAMYDQFFILPNGDKMLHPHDEMHGASAENIINCSCGTFDIPV